MFHPRIVSTVLALVLCGAAPAGAATVAVTIDNFTFGPETVTIHPGDAVTWTNRDDIPHTVRADSGSFKCKVMDTGESCTITFKEAGEFKYFCSLHPHMTGTIVVKPE